MAEDQEKQKPKATLIKHRHEERPSESEDSKAKKVRVVVRRKPKPKPRPADADAPQPTTRQETKPSDAAGTAGRPAPKPVEATESGAEAAPAAETAASAGIKRSGADQEGAQRPPETAKAERPAARPEATEGASPAGATSEKPKSGKPASPEKRENPFTVKNYNEPPPSVRESARVSGRTAGGRPGGPGGRTGAPSGRPPRPGGGRPSGPPSARGPRPAGPRRPPGPGRPGMGPRPGAPPASTDEKKPAGKKFFKTKRKEQYPRKERHQEKEIHYKQKRARPKINPVPKEIDIMEVVSVSELAKKMNLKASDLIAKLMSMGMMVTINQQIDAETATLLAEEYGCTVNIVSLYDETLIETGDDQESDMRPRPPVVTVMGHVDHGKTKLLDTIRRTNVVAGEHGGITQHIGAYQVAVGDGVVTFLDTPGHEAFTQMRARGAKVTDIVVLVVAANDGVMPQTREAVDHAKAANVPIIVAVNKVDLEDANPDRVRQQLSDLDLIPEEWGGNTLFVNVSALKGDGVDGLLESVVLQSEVLELKANFDRNAEGTVIESKIDPGRGTVSTVLIERGTLKVGDSFVAGIYPGKVRSMFNDRGDQVQSAGPSMPVEILGFTGIPQAGDPFQVTENEKYARQVGDKRQELKKVEEARNVKKITLDNLYDSIQEGEVQELKVIIKGDVHGSVEALQSSLEKLSTPAIRLSVLRAAAGAVNESDVMLASASDAIIVGFHVRPTPRIQTLAEQEKVEIRKYNVIYDVVDDIKNAMEGLLAPEFREKTIGTAEVRETFKVPKIGVIAGCYVTTGVVRRNASAHVTRDGVELYTGKISSLKRFKDDAREVGSGYECGIGIENFNDLKPGDVIEAYEVEKIAKRLEETVKNG